MDEVDVTGWALRKFVKMTWMMAHTVEFLFRFNRVWINSRLLLLLLNINFGNCLIHYNQYGRLLLLFIPSK